MSNDDTKKSEKISDDELDSAVGGAVSGSDGLGPENAEEFTEGGSGKKRGDPRVDSGLKTPKKEGP